MYIVTFYSYKGGVGRTMGLANVGFELAQQGRSVLIVDFDLEAPGLGAFLVNHGSRAARGVVDFVVDYRQSRQPPSIENYVYQVGGGSSSVWFMPAGRQGNEYGSKLHSIDWRTLYEEEDGYLLFEDLKEQWRSVFDPDYVLIDSRTGHTDVGGICTRQLPDAVALMFRLDHQNLEGLTRVTKDIRSEGRGPRKKDIKIHFIPSNVPRLDDEKGLLDDHISLFKNELDVTSPMTRIQHYEDLGMLKHTIYTLERPKTRIAGEYRSLTQEISRFNTDDVEGARDYLRRAANQRGYESAETIESRIDRISAKHRYDQEILKLLADVRQRQGKLNQAVSYLTEALEAGASSSENLLRRAELYQRLGRNSEAGADIRSILRGTLKNFFEVYKLINIARDVDKDVLSELASSVAVSSLDAAETRALAHELLTDSSEFEIAIDILESVLRKDDLDEQEFEKTSKAMVLPLIGIGRFDEALHTLSKPENVGEMFNFAMADWGCKGGASSELFSNVIEEHEDLDDEVTSQANYDFCIAIAYRVLDKPKKASEYFSAARQDARETIGSIFLSLIHI